jgi:uncharacterized protein (UPF0333 family)/glutaredoxin
MYAACAVFALGLLACTPLAAQATSTIEISEPVVQTIVQDMDSEKEPYVGPTAESPAVIQAFVREDCQHCKDLEEFLDLEVQNGRPFSVEYLDIDEGYFDLFEQVAEQYEMTKSTPITLINGHLVQGFGTAETTGDLIMDLAYQELDGRTMQDIASGGATVVTAGIGAEACSVEGCEYDPGTFEVQIPFIGSTIDVGNFSLGSMSLILGLVDGFNPCALWVLIMFIMILTQIGSRKKMIQYIGIFILAEAIMYYLILNVWFTTWNFISLNRIVTPLVGLLALGSGVYFCYKFYTYSPVCKVTSLDQQRKLSAKVKALAEKPMSIAVFFGILGVAFSVNIFEFACSIGIPQTYTKILELNMLSWIVRQGYMALYILMYMFDDIIVFSIALYSIEKIGLTHKYSKWTTLIGGLLMLALGCIMLLKPELLIF